MDVSFTIRCNSRLIVRCCSTVDDSNGFSNDNLRDASACFCTYTIPEINEKMLTGVIDFCCLTHGITCTDSSLHQCNATASRQSQWKADDSLQAHSSGSKPVPNGIISLYSICAGSGTFSSVLVRFFLFRPIINWVTVLLSLAVCEFDFMNHAQFGKPQSAKAVHKCVFCSSHRTKLGGLH